MSRKFAEIKRIEEVYRPVTERVKDYHEVERRFAYDDLKPQAERCMNCGIPFCHGAGCPLENNVPEINAAVAKGDFATAWAILSETSPFPEFTSRVCPALCEAACCCGVNFEPVMVRQLEKLTVETAYANQWIAPIVPAREKPQNVAIVGGGPAGLASAAALRKLGFKVTVYDKNPLPGGLLRYGIPNFKLEKTVIDRRLELLKLSGILFVPDTKVGTDLSLDYLAHRYDAVLVCCGTPVPRDLKAPGRELAGIHFALEFLNGIESAAGKNVLVIGGGDTGSDCVGTAIRQKAKSILQIEIMPKPPVERSSSTPWPNWPYLLRTSSSHHEGCQRRWNLQTLRFLGKNRVEGIEAAAVDWELKPNGAPLKFTASKNPPETIQADIVMLAMGFLKNDRAGLLAMLGAAEDRPNIFVAGDAANGPSLVVRAIRDGLNQSAKLAAYLEGNA